MNKSLILFLLLVMVSCYKQRPSNEHYCLFFENSSDNAIYVADQDAPSMAGRISYPFHRPEEFCKVAPGSINEKTIPLVYNLTYEDLFKSYEVYHVYVFPEFYDYPVRWEEHKLVRYDLTLKDLVSLDFHLYYPPNEKMKEVEMDPAYKYFH